MHRLSTMTFATSTPQRRQRGISLIESLIAIVVTALGILGILGVQMRTLSDTSTTVRRAQAIRLIEDLGERMRVNPNALANIGVFNGTLTVSPPANCDTGCSIQARAAYDLKTWKDTVASNLPGGQATVFLPPAEAALAAGQRRQLGIMIAWRENERHDADTSYKDNINATKIFDGSTFKEAGGAAATCPVGSTCHLQYIPVSSRCAPYSPGGNAASYYCPGA